MSYTNDMNYVKLSSGGVILSSTSSFSITTTQYQRQTHEGKRKKTSLEKYSPLTLLQGFERVVQGFACERVLETEHKLHLFTPLLWPSRCVFLVLLDAQPEVLGSTAGCWLSLWHLISIFSGPLTPSGVFRGPPRSGVAFTTTSGL